MGRPSHSVTSIAKTAADPLDAVRPLFQSVVSGLDLALIVIDRDHHIMLANKHANRWLKRPLEEISDQHCYTVFRNRDAVCPDCPAVVTFQTGEMVRIIHSGLGKADGITFAEVSAYPIRDAAGVVQYCLESRRDVSERIGFERELVDKNRRLAILSAIASAVNSSLDLGQILEQALDSVLELMGLRPIGGIFLLSEERQELQLAVQRGLSPEFVRQEAVVRLGECLCGQAAETGEIFHSPDSKADERHSRASDADAHAHLIVPLKSRNRVQGVMFLSRARPQI